MLELMVVSEYAEKGVKILEHAICDVYNHNASRLSFEKLHRNAYNMVLHKYGEQLYSGLVSTMTFHLQAMAKSIEAAQGASFLDKLNVKWNDHNQAVEMIRDILMHMERTFIQSTKKTTINELGLNLWRDCVLHSNNIQPRLLNSILKLIWRERTGEFINRGLMRNTVKILMDLEPSVYQEDFEKPFLQVSADFYRVESQEYIECCDCADYLKRAERRLNEEIDRVSHYLDAKTETKITNVVEKEMIANHMLRLVHMENSGLVKMLLDDKLEDLARIYNLFNRVPNGLSIIRDLMTLHMRDTGSQLVTDPEKSNNPGQFAETLLEKRVKYDKIISLAFSNDKTFQNALVSSFEYFINLNPRTAEYISLFADYLLRKCLKGIKDEDVEFILDKVIILFRYLHEKDLFEKYYRLHLAKRLLSGKTLSDDAERSLIVKLKTECGHQFTSKLEDMMMDRHKVQGIYTNRCVGFHCWILAYWIDPSLLSTASISDFWMGLLVES